MSKKTYFIIKRVLDLILVIPIAILFAPVMLVTYLIVLVMIGKPALFRQERPGLHGQPFVIYKFRTMNNKKDKNGELLPDEMRMTHLGSFLRKTSLDELPEIINVLNGSMSLVGPRPLLMQYLGRYSPEQSRRHKVKPGITGWAQVNGRNAISWEEKFKLDIWYVDNWGLYLDVKILLITMWKILKREGINHPGMATMEEFKGN
ncbi:MAG: sugar transferase [Candidatus Cloacimonadia bacterium]